MAGLFAASDGVARCGWCAASEDYIAYHDDEWGYPVSDDRRLFEKLSLEGFQSGLSWRTILTKRENFRAAFHGFDFHRVAAFDETDVERLLQDAGIVRHRGKIEAVINNAQRVQDLVRESGSFAAYVWSFEPRDEVPHLASTSPASIAMSKDLKTRGWKFVGPTTVHAFMQAMGLFNDHAEGCAIRERVAKAYAGFQPPQG
ncbi:DNA-3-methyladenine glycosylase I [Sphingobium sp. B7D2B]|uniref:DNA-3-methyladenine glycosylase I n=1 Tax=Sphingobium sp. B7D2B TaxID=2940583 RepID=UPI0029CAAD87|nr:DNA-3-methyladenine glycosylase I [Sphingobium sp. B7D2B]MCW2366318.1 DNA-3-methyladenine glycosylase I [Sphingobium sp. B7D2B]